MPFATAAWGGGVGLLPVGVPATPWPYTIQPRAVTDRTILALGQLGNAIRDTVAPEATWRTPRIYPEFFIR
jgi:hypothetical protein